MTLTFVFGCASVASAISTRPSQNSITMSRRRADQTLTLAQSGVLMKSAPT